MAWRFRKSVNIGGFRINFSKIGICYSFGAAGLRYTKKSDGGTRLTSSIKEQVYPIKKIGQKKESKSFDKNEELIELNSSEKEVIQSELEQSTQNDLVDKFNTMLIRKTLSTKRKKHGLLLYL